MKLDTVIPNEAPAIVAESQQRRLGKYQVRKGGALEYLVGGRPTRIAADPELALGNIDVKELV